MSTLPDEKEHAGVRAQHGSNTVANTCAGDVTQTGRFSHNKEAIEYLRSLLAEADRDVGDETVQMFINATGGNMKLSAKRLTATLDWRRKTKPETVVCQACCKNPRAHYMHLVGYDKLQRPAIYSCNALNNDHVFQDHYNHMLQTFEMAIRAMPEGVTQWVWVADFKGFGMADMSPKLAKAFLDMSATYYPERLGMFVLVDTPAVFSVLWNAIEKLVDPKTHQKVRFVPYDLAKGTQSSKLHSLLSQHFDADTVEWLEEEMKENRDKATVKSKVYDYRSIHHSASSGLMPGASGECDSDSDGSASPLSNQSSLDSLSSSGSGPHDVRGSPGILAAYARTPSLLEPQGTACCQGC